MTENQDSFDAPTSAPDDSGRGAVSPEPSAPPAPLDESNLPGATNTLAGVASMSGGTATSAASNSTDEAMNQEKTRLQASGIAAAVLGFFFGGPFLSFIFGGGAYYAATQRPNGDTAGDAARALGDVALVIRDRAKELDEKHQIVEKSKKAAGSLWQKSKAKGEELSNKHDVVGKSCNFFESAWRRAVDFDKEHHVVENTKLLVLNLWTAVVKKISENGGQSRLATNVRSPSSEGTSTSTTTAK